MDNKISGIVTPGSKVDRDLAQRLSRKFNTDILNEAPVDKYASFFVLEKSGLSFVSGGQVLKGDFIKLLPRITGGHIQHEILLKAAKQSDLDKQSDNGPIPKAIDATAGLGEDSFILAAGGYEVELFEHNPITCALLNDALIRARNDARLRDIAKRMHLTEGDSKDFLENISYRPDIIYLDPMFPEKKKSAETKKKLQVLHQIELPCADENELLEAAINAKPVKIIIKRPPDGAYLGGIKPSYSITRKAVRFDCIYLA